MPVPPAQLAILASLGDPQAVRALAQTNGLPYDTAYKAVRELTNRGILATHRDGRALVVACRSAVIPSLARSLLFDHPRPDWGRVFHGDRPMLLRVLDQVGDPGLAAEVCGKSRSLVYHAIKTHAPRGLLVRRDDSYSINPRLATLRRLLEELNRVETAHQLHQIDADATPLWSLGPEILFASRKKLTGKGVHLGAISRFYRYRMSFITGETTYYYVAKRKLDAADAIIQTLLIDPESRINHSYAALLFEKAKPADLQRRSKIYGLAEEAHALTQYVQTHEATAKFLPWREHERYRQQYGVAS